MRSDEAEANTKMRAYPLLIIGAVLFFSAVSAQSADSPFNIAITPSHDVVKAGTEIRLRIVLTNKLDHDITFVDIDPQCDYEVSVWDAHGNPTPLTQLGRLMNKAGCKTYLQTVTRPTLKARGMPSDNAGLATDVANIAVTDLYDMSGAGQYTIQVQRDVPESLGGGFARSNTVTVRVTE